MSDIKDLRCIVCDKKLAVNTTSYDFEVASTASVKEGIQTKCDRCGVINTIYPYRGYLTWKE